MAEKRKYTSLSIDTKYAALKEVDCGTLSKKDIAIKYGIPSSTLSTWIKQGDSIKAKYQVRYHNWSHVK
jgi:transposase